MLLTVPASHGRRSRCSRFSNFPCQCWLTFNAADSDCVPRLPGLCIHRGSFMGGLRSSGPGSWPPGSTLCLRTVTPCSGSLITKISPESHSLPTKAHLLALTTGGGRFLDPVIPASLNPADFSTGCPEAPSPLRKVKRKLSKK